MPGRSALHRHCKNFAEAGDDGFAWIFAKFGEKLESHDASTFNEVMAECGGYETLNLDCSGKAPPAVLVEDSDST